MTTEKAPDVRTGTVVFMGEFLIRRHKEMTERQTNLVNLANKISKNPDNPHNDPFAGPLLAKAERFKEPLEAIENHIRFIMRGGRGAELDSRGYSLQYRNPPPLRMPPFRVEVTQPKP